MFVTLALDPSSDPLITDAGGGVISNYTIAEVQANLFGGLPSGVDPTTDPLTSQLLNFFECSGTFTSTCTQGPPYDFVFGPSISSNLDVEPGNSIDFLLGTFTPTGGVAPPGTYTFLNGGMEIFIYDQAFPSDPSNPSSPSGLPIANIPVAGTSASGVEFTLDVVGSAPEPGSGLLLLAGFGLVGVSPSAGSSFSHGKGAERSGKQIDDVSRRPGHVTLFPGRGAFGRLNRSLSYA